MYIINLFYDGCHHFLEALVPPIGAGASARQTQDKWSLVQACGMRISVHIYSRFCLKNLCECPDLYRVSGWMCSTPPV